ncbi:MAG: hypothetical protein ACI4AK_04875 [Lepagella sp.]
MKIRALLAKGTGLQEQVLNEQKDWVDKSNDTKLHHLTQITQKSTKDYIKKTPQIATILYNATPHRQKQEGKGKLDSCYT